MAALPFLPIFTVLAAGAPSGPVDAAIAARSRPQVQRYSIEQLFATRTIGDAAWSADGARIVVVTNISGRNNLWLVPAAGGWPIQLTMIDQIIDGPNEIVLVNPRYILPAIAVSPTESPPNQPQQNVEHTTMIGAHGHGRAQQYLPRPREDDLVGRSFPGLGHLDAEPPGVGSVRLRPA